ncbi:MAG: rhodanese-related sulfurtransferase [Balneolaceae bacterium]|nr:rhodanese-related sulfurtransferase [Balneolaceae bacterium]
MSYDVILYYRFREIEDPEAFCAEHHAFCEELGVKGRIYIGREGINGTLAGTPEQVRRYREHLESIEGFDDMDWKTDEADFIPFPRLTVKTRDEIVSLHEEADPAAGGAYLEPAEWREVLESEEDYLLIDVRNDYESRIGHFEGALTPQVENFYDFPEWLEGLEANRDRKVLMYCTGGIRCEKFSVLMRKKGFRDVNQLHGGILRYGEQEGGAHFKGKCFVFDDRLVVPVGKEEGEPIARCEITGKPADTYI